MSLQPTRAEPGPSPLAWLLLIVTPGLMASNMLAARWIGDSLPPVGTAMGRWTLTLALLLPLTLPRLWRARAELRLHWRRYLALGALGMGVCGPPVYVGGQTTSATNIGLIYTATPIAIVLFERLGWGQPIAGRTALGIALCMSGVLLILGRGDPSALLGLAFTAGDLWIVLATAGWALYSVLLRRWPSPLDLGTRFAAIVLAGVVVLLPFHLAEVLLHRGTPLDLRTLAVVAFLALVPGLAAFLAYGRLVTLLGPSRTGMLLYLTPLYNLLLAYLLLGEQPQPFHLAGILLILPGLWLSTGRGRRATGG